MRRAQQKVCALARLASVIGRAKARGRRVVLTNGCFDLLHAGHVKVLEQAKGLGDILIVALNSDASVRRLKGAGRPILPQRDRALLLAALASVDYVTVFGEDTPLRVVRRLRPHVLVKGADWQTGRIVGRDLVEASGGRVVRVPLVKGLSTSRLIARIRRRRE